MRIISGQLKGLRFSPPKSFKARPTTDFAKENLFNVLNNTISFEGIDVLDLFGGTGSISYEFASRGANHVTCIEKRFQHFKFISDTVNKLNLNNLITVVRSCAFRYTEKSDSKFDVIFADPPYDLPESEKIIDTILSRGLLKKEGLLIFEHSSDKDFSKHINFKYQRNNGKVIFSFFSI